MLIGPWSPLDFDGAGCEQKCHSELPGASDFFRGQSCEVKGGGSISNEDEDGDGGLQGSAELVQLSSLWISIQDLRPRSGP